MMKRPLIIFLLLVFLFLLSFATSLKLEAVTSSLKILEVTPNDSIDLREVESDLGSLPESLSQKVDSLLTEQYSGYYMIGKPEKDENSHSFISTHIPDSVYISRLEALPSEIVLSYNSVVRECIDTYVNKRRTLVASMLPKTGVYFPMIEEVFDRYDIPLELKYLAIVESNLTPTAVSRRGATGIWQFMLATGKMYGLEINSLVDERRDPFLSTEAAARYFKEMYSIYGDWSLVMASYNCGPGNVNKAIQRAGGSRKFWDIFPYLPRETRAYVPFFIAAYYTMEYYKDHGIVPYSLTFPYATDTVHIYEKRTFKEVSDMSGVDLDIIKNLNPKYKKEVIPGNSGRQIVHLPSNSALEFSKKMVALKNTSEMELIANSADSDIATTDYTEIKHIVKNKETIGSIARQYRVSISELKGWNNLKSNLIKVGDVLVIRIPKDQNKSLYTSTLDFSEPSKKSSITRSKDGVRYYTVRRGDTLGGIARKYKGVTVRSLKQANGLKSNMIRVGQKLIIP